VEVISQFDQGREAYARRAWTDAYESLSRADRATPLEAEGLELLATSAYMLGRDDEYVSGLERAHHAYLDSGEGPRAVRCAFWIGTNLRLRGAIGGATGWLARARRLLDRDGRDCVERGYLLLSRMFEHEAAGEHEAAIAAAADAAAIGERFADADLFALAALDEGVLLIKLGRVTEGLALLDEAMVAVTAGELSPIVNGFIYCGVITGCQAAYEPRRAQEWTAALTSWCEQQPDMVSFTGTCLVHRAEIMQLRGAWPDALQEARRAVERCALAMNEAAAAQAVYRQGEVRRLQGEFAAAEAAYRKARRGGFEPQPGLALLRLAQGDGEAAAAAIRRLVHETSDPSRRALLLAAQVEIMLGIGDAQAAHSACVALEELAERWVRGMMGAMVAYARGALELADGDAGAALVTLRHAWQSWRELDAPYEAARARVLAGVACRALGDDESAALELEAAREVFSRLGAAPDLARVDSLTGRDASPDTHALTPRELQVLRLVAAGETNKAIAAELVISERTVDRHVSNILAKVGVSSRAAATAYAYQHQLV
jgi:DNA-binding NarL/FixJ family response regulator